VKADQVQARARDQYAPVFLQPKELKARLTQGVLIILIRLYRPADD
jgi:hypothetical protein